MATPGGARQGAGRKKGYAAIEAEKAWAFIAKRVVEELAPIVDKAIEQATKDGDRAAREWLTDRAFGKATQFIATDPDHPLVIEGVEVIIRR